MEAFERIQLSFKCPKALDELQPCNSNWYCDGCQQMVYDFRGFTEEAILDTFAQSGQKLCGIYDANRIKVLSQKRKWYKLVPAAVLLTGLAACNQQQPKHDNLVGLMMYPPALGKIKVTHTLGEPLIAPKDTHAKKKTVAFPPPTLMVGDVQVREAKPTGISVTDSANLMAPDVKKDTTITENDLSVGFLAVDIYPSFPGSEVAFAKYLHQQINYTGSFTGLVFVSFVIETDGSPDEIKIISGGERDLNDEIIEGIKNSPHWLPGVHSGKKYRLAYTMPISFSK